MDSLSNNNKKAGIIKVLNSTSRYLDDLKILTIPTLKAWQVEFIHLNYS